MSLRKQVLDEVDSTIRDIASGAVEAWARANLRKQANPARWASFHAEMYRRLPRWRRIAKGWHQMRARRFKALVTADNPLTASLSQAYPSV